MNQHATISPGSTELRPGWPEIVAALLTYMVCVIGIGVWMYQIPDEQAALRGNIGMAANGAAGTAGLLVAFALRIRRFRPFGFRAVEGKWLFAGAAWGLAAFGASFVIEHVYFSYITEPNTQGDFQAAAQQGWLALLVLLVTGAILTPLGEEFVFRGVVANALNRYGVLAGVVGSAAIFGVAHGLNVILLLAFMVGILAGILFRRTNSIWPGVMTHVVYNGLHLIYYSTL